MENDFEKSAFKIDERVDILEKKVEDLELNIEESNDEVEKLKLSGFQEQIALFNGQINLLRESILATSRHSAFVDVENLLYNFRLWISFNLSHDQKTYYNAKDFIERTSSAAKQGIALSEFPISVAQKFRKQCTDYCKRHNFEAFQED